MTKMFFIALYFQTFDEMTDLKLHFVQVEVVACGSKTLQSKLCEEDIHQLTAKKNNENS